MYPHARRRRHSLSPSPLPRGFDHDDCVRPSDGGSDLLPNGRYAGQSGPAPRRTYHDAHGRPSVPVDGIQHGRGRRPTRQAVEPDGRGSGYDDAGSVGPPGYRYGGPSRARRSQSHSQARAHAHNRDGARGSPPPSRRPREARGSTSSWRSKSASSSSHHERGSDKTGTPWWRNPILRACAVTALSTGLTVALDSRGDPGHWKGAKGAKVAVATAGSAVVDGFLGQKHPDGARQKLMKKGMEVAMDEAEKKKHRSEEAVGEEEKDEGRRRSSGRHDSTNRDDGRRHRSHGGSHRRRH